MILTVKQRLQALAELGRWMDNPGQDFDAVVRQATQHNAWFTEDCIRQAVAAIAHLLHEDALDQWMNRELAIAGLQASGLDTYTPKDIGLVLAGNIPLVGFHDVLCVLATGNRAQIKLSSQDDKLLPYILNRLASIEPGFVQQLYYTQRLTSYQAVIATGSNNTSRYFDYYFADVPHIIRKNRSSIAVLTGPETPAQLHALGYDVFDYFGLGCRNVSKLYVPSGYDFTPFFEAVESFKQIIHHHKYNNNYGYNRSVYLVNLDRHLDNGFVLLKPDEGLASPLAVLYYEEYDSIARLAEKLLPLADHLQCLVTDTNTGLPVQHVAFGETQRPKLHEYADGVNTVQFLLNLGAPD